MKNLLAFLFLAVFLTATAPAFAADYTADEIAFMTSKAVFEDPATEKKMRSIMPDAMNKLNTITSGTTGAVTIPALAATTASSGATLVGVYDTAGYFTATALEGVLAELGLSRSKLALTTEGNGASLIGVFDDAGYFTATTVEAVLAEIGLELSTTMPVIETPSDGYFPLITALGTIGNSAYQPSDFALASQVGAALTIPADVASDTIPADPGVTGYRVFMTDTDTVYDEGKVYTWNDTTNLWDAGVLVTNGQIVSIKGSTPDTCVGGATATDYVCLSDKGPSPSCKTITVALGADSGVTDADPDWVGVTIHSVVPVSGNDQAIESIAVAGDGVVTLTTAAVETAEAVFRVCTWMD